LNQLLEDREERKKLNEIFKFIVVFIPSIILFSLILPSLPPSSFWFLILVPAVVWFVAELKINREDKRRIIKAITIGMLLVIFNLIINYTGAIRGIYTISSQYSLFFILGNPVELLLISLFGGAAWFLHLPKKFDLFYSTADIIMLSSFGTMTELFILIPNNLMTYISVIFPDPFFTYALVWSILHLIYYKVI